jgi:hypothetical protein
MRKIEEGRRLSGKVIALWGACLAVFVNLHYFGTIFGGLLTLTLLIGLAVRRLWLPMGATASVSMLAAAWRCFSEGFRFSTPKGLMSLDQEGFMNLFNHRSDANSHCAKPVAVGFAVVMFFFSEIAKEGELWIAAILSVVGLFLGRSSWQISLRR